MTETKELEKRVIRGMRHLESLYGIGWFREIDLGRLDLGYDCNCVLGQLFDDFESGACHVGLDEDELVSHGFLVISDDPDVYTPEYERLTDIWKDFIKDLYPGK